MADLLLEILSEEIPARMQVRAGEDLLRGFERAFEKSGFKPETMRAFSGPRRLTLHATGLPARTADLREERKGPRVGAPEKAVAGFLKAAGLSSLDECEQREDKKGAYWVALIEKPGVEGAALVAEITADVIRDFPWKKSMRWGDGPSRWVRPLHGILCLFDGAVVPFDVAGVSSGALTRGHRFMANEPIVIADFDAYQTSLRAAKVILDADERRSMIERDAAALCAGAGVRLLEDAGLLNEVSGLAEWPVTMMGTFDKKFLQLPDEVLTASMRGHQKYFSVQDGAGAALTNKFVYVANVETPDDGAAMRDGYERVLTARLSDGWHLYKQDLKMPLGDRVDALSAITFFEGLGTVKDRADRMTVLASKIADEISADRPLTARAATLAKADLVTGMVYEFPELQGVMGRYYALEEGMSAEIADAIRGSLQAARSG